MFALVHVSAAPSRRTVQSEEEILEAAELKLVFSSKEAGKGKST